MFVDITSDVKHKVLVKLHKETSTHAVDNFQVTPKWCTAYVFENDLWNTCYIKAIDLIKQGYSIDEVYLMSGNCVDGERIFGFRRNQLDVMINE